MDYDFSDDYDGYDDPEDNDEYEDESYIVKTYVCEECDFRWTEKIYPERNDYPDYEDELGGAHVCPMCGTGNVSFY
ncbi:MAG TPA: hypothetical protein VMZ05_04130 [Spirochaetota bacterium]|nr:hypothetical protein [Spirochaetota bacterium]